MISKLRRRFIRIALLVLALAMVLVLAIVNLSNWLSVRQELLNTVSLIAGTAPVPPGGTPAPDETPVPDQEDSDGLARIGPEQTGHSMSWERFQRGFRNDRHAWNLINESSWFSVLESTDGSLSFWNSQRMDSAEAESDTLLDLARRGLLSGSASGFLEDYAFQVRSIPEGRLILFLNCETRLAAVRTLLLISALASAGAILLAWLLVSLFSHKAVEPTLRNMEQQKRFITDASHELKTPLSVISTNMELLRMELPENQWVRSTQKQTGILRHLVDELVYLSRMEEENPTLVLEPLSLSSLLEEVAEPFQSMAEFEGREFALRLTDALYVRGDRAALHRLFSTLCENAVKYASGEGSILMESRPDGRGSVAVTLSNPVSERLSPEQCAHLFDRFYRADPSRNKGKQNGFGIGLAIAAAITEKHGGSISAVMEQEDRLAFTCILPRAASAAEKERGKP